MKINLIKITVLLFLVLSCSIDEHYYYCFSRNQNINIYFVKDGQLNFTASKVDLDTIRIETTPWLKQSEIDFYDWSSHIFYLHNEKKKETQEGRFFVVSNNNKRLFLGIFFPMYMSSIPQIPAIIASEDFFYPNDVVALGGYSFFESTNILDKNFEFKEALQNAGLLQYGIEVDLLKVKQINSTSIQYTYKVTNLDSDKIYILDPDKMGASRFHYYTNGVSFRHSDQYYYPQNIKSTASDKILSSWYYRLLPGQSLTRTVKLEGFQSLPSGKIEAYFNFPGSSVKSGEWEKRDGRIWLGNFRIEKEMTLQ
ncbi:MAG: hypothetical protein HQ541_02930 [Mariniphaga sp.]|nr:hypothetical protein [Mariniphaga sp.]